jgi:PAS domain S-box-containing protein
MLTLEAAHRARTARALRTLKDLQIDPLVALARRTLEARAAFVSIALDGVRAVRAAHGAPLFDTPLEHSVCARVMGVNAPQRAVGARLARDGLMDFIPDAQSYCGYPLRLRDGRVIGAFAIIDARPRRRTAGFDAALESFARTAADLVQARIDGAILETLEHLRGVIETGAGVGFWLTDRVTGETEWSPGLFDLLGAARDGEHVAQAGADDWPLFGEAWADLRRRALTEDDAIAMRLDCRAPNGDARALRVVGAPMTGPDGAVEAFQGVFIDETELLRASRESAANQALLASFIADAPAALAMFDRDMRYLHVSPRWRAEYKLGDRPLVGESHYDVFPEISEAWRDLHRRCLAGESFSHARDRFVRGDGRVQYLSWEIRPWRDASGDIGGVMMCTRDLTAEVNATRELERLRDRIRLAIDIGGLLIWELDTVERKVIIDGDPTAKFDIDFSDDYGKQSAFALTHPDDRAAAIAAWRNHVRTGAPYRLEHRLNTRSGAERWVLAVAKALKNAEGDPIGAVGLMVDITARKRDALALADAKNAAEAANRAKTDFLAVMSHEIRTPLHGVLGMAHALQSTRLTDQQAHMVATLLESGETLSGLLNDILDATRIESSDFSLAQTAFSLADMLRPILATEGQKAAAKGVAFNVDIDPHAHGVYRGDPLRIAQILYNLIGNALKFTAQGEVRVAVSRTTAPDGLAFRVADTGIGFDDSDKARLFQRFEQAHAPGAAFLGGVGLGLSICRTLVKRMGGSIDCRATPGAGAEFWFSIPLESASVATTPAADAPTIVDRLQPALRALCAEDHPVNRKVIDLALSAIGVQTSFAANGREAIEMVRVGAFDVVLMDALMPETDGLAATRAIRAWETQTRRARTPIIGLTAQASPDHVAQCLAAGMDSVLAKPFKPEALAAALRAAVSAPADARCATAP